LRWLVFNFNTVPCLGASDSADELVSSSPEPEAESENKRMEEILKVIMIKNMDHSFLLLLIQIWTPLTNDVHWVLPNDKIRKIQPK
jgi:hypothetical protein